MPSAGSTQKKNAPRPPVRSVADKLEYRQMFQRKRGLLFDRAARRKELPASYLNVESPPISTFDDNPVVNDHGAAKILGLSAELLKKCRQRDMGPDYIQYGPSGPVRYEVNSLKAFREAHRVKVGSR